MEYGNDHNGNLPDSFRTALMDTDIASDAFISPLTNDTAATGPSTQATADQLLTGQRPLFLHLSRQRPEYEHDNPRRDPGV